MMVTLGRIENAMKTKLNLIKTDMVHKAITW